MSPTKQKPGPMNPKVGLKVGRGGTGRLARFGIATQVLLTVGLAVAAVVLVNWLAGRPGLRVRMDLTETGQNTLAPQTLDILSQLPGPVTIDVFYRPQAGPTSQLAADVMNRTFALLILMTKEGGDNLEVRNNDMSDSDAVMARLRELNLRGFENCLVVHRAGHRQVVRLNGDLARFDPGNPDRNNFKPARVTSFDAEASIVQALLEASRGDERPKIYFTWGHGERDILGIDDSNDMGLLQSALVKDGFEATRWSFLEDGALPDDTAALAIIGPVNPLTDDELAAIEKYVDDGGRLVIAPAAYPAEMLRSRVPELLEKYGIAVSSGIVCQPYIDPATGRPGIGQNLVNKFLIAPANMERHPIVDPIRRGDLNFLVSGSHQVRVSRQPEKGQGSTAPLFRSFAQSWIDGFDKDGRNNWEPDDGVEAIGRRFELAVTSAFVPAGYEVVPDMEVRREARIVAVGAADLFCDANFNHNADLLRNLFNWITDREYRLSISTRDPDQRRLAPDVVPRVSLIALWGLPGLALVLGVLTAFLRARGGPRRSSSATPGAAIGGAEA